ncbi:MAG TPA: proline--tRNA ligase [bacterium]
MRLTQYLVPTLREDPAEAEVVSHRLMLRAGMIRKTAAGVYSFLPLGLRALRRVEAIVRGEMDRAGALEVLLPALSPAELWRETGRWDVYGRELMRLRDRHDRDFCLGPTHEEVITDLVRREVRSWRQLPVNLYQIQTKFRDEIRPRFGLMRGREFGMKDAYSFDRDEAGAEESYRAMFCAYQRIFERCGLRFKAVEADSGQIGGSFSHEFMVLADTGEDAVVSCTACGYAANLEKAQVAQPARTEDVDAGRLPARVATPGMRTVEEVTAFLGVDAQRLVKTLLFDAGGEIVAVLVRGDHQVNETKLKNHLGGREAVPATPAQVEKATGAPVGFAGPVGLAGVPVFADRHVEAMAHFVVGANAADTHLKDVCHGRDFAVAAFADLKSAEPGDPCAKCGKPLEIVRGIEVGHVFKLGTKYTRAMQAVYLDEQGKEQEIVMGCYGIGTGRTVAASVEQNHDADGIIWPVPLAPFPVHLVTMSETDAAVRAAAEALSADLEKRGIEVLWDDRDERPGVKFKDADLLGMPLRVVLGGKSLAKGVGELRVRRTGEKSEAPLAELAATVERLLGTLV